jgi:hypothetical protein
MKIVLVVWPEEKLIFTVDRKLEVSVLYSGDGVLDAWLHGQKPTALDGELVEEVYESGEKKYIYCVFDAMGVN